MKNTNLMIIIVALFAFVQISAMEKPQAERQVNPNLSQKDRIYLHEHISYLKRQLKNDQNNNEIKKELKKSKNIYYGTQPSPIKYQ